jgi:hypothetical protein
MPTNTQNIPVTTSDTKQASTTTVPGADTKPADQDLARESAIGLLNRDVFLPVFLQKLASDYNVVPQGENDLADLLDIYAYLKSADQLGLAKTANQRSTFFKQAKDFLATSLGGQTPASRDLEIKQAAAQVCSNPAYRDAALLFADAQARQLAN